MGAARAAAVVLAISGCDIVFAIKAVPDAHPDAPADAILIDGPPVAFSCRRDHASAELCADFDEASPSYFVNGTELGLSLGTSGTIDVNVGPFEIPRSAPNSLDVSSHGGSYAPMFVTTKAYSRMVADFDIRIDSTSTNFTNFAGLVRLAANGTPFSSCYVDFSIEVQQPFQELVLVNHCGGSTSVVVSPGIPLDWFHVKFELDLDVPRGTAAIDDLTSHDIGIGSGASLAPLGGYLSLGMLNPGFDNIHVTFDNVVVELDPPL